MAVETNARAHPAQTSDTLRIDFLFLDLTTCTRCLGADRSLASALEVVREVLEATGVEVEVGKILVESAEQARALRFVSSPTIRVDGQDVALELRESSCGSEACTDGCGDQIACRVWVTPRPGVHRAAGRDDRRRDPGTCLRRRAVAGRIRTGALRAAREPHALLLGEVRIGRIHAERLLSSSEQDSCCETAPRDPPRSARADRDRAALPGERSGLGRPVDVRDEVPRAARPRAAEAAAGRVL